MMITNVRVPDYPALKKALQEEPKTYQALLKSFNRVELQRLDGMAEFNPDMFPLAMTAARERLAEKTRG